MLKIVLKNKWIHLPINNIHALFDQATPTMVRDISTARALYDTLTNLLPESILPSLTYNYIENRRHKGVLFTASNRMLIGHNSLSHRVSETAKKLEEGWNDMDRKSFKKYTKKVFSRF
jgi:hypothetical protein